MAASKQCLFLIILVSSTVGGLGLSDSMTCMQKLVACQPHFKSPEKAPATCCTPMKEMISEDSEDKECLCGAFNNPDLLQNFNTNKEEATKLLKACGAKVDISAACSTKKNSMPEENAMAPSPAQPVADSPPPPTPASSNEASQLSKYSIAVFFVVLISISSILEM